MSVSTTSSALASIISPCTHHHLHSLPTWLSFLNERFPLTEDVVEAAMRIALKQLGYNDTYHMMSVMENPMDGEMWIEAYEAKYFGKGKPYGREEWDQLLGHCQVKYPTYRTNIHHNDAINNNTLTTTPTPLSLLPNPLIHSPPSPRPSATCRPPPSSRSYSPRTPTPKSS